MAEPANPETLCVIVLYAPQARTVLEKTLQLPAGSTVGDALRATGWQSRPEVRELIEKGPEAAQLSCGIWSKPCVLSQVLQAGDRLELYRPLLVDPKVARRERFARQGSRTAGLFARKRGPAPR
ncbi:MAG: RnfH family protein [Brachymonas sp.]|nr:RnfH family protein [Brachymonas sp.]